MHLHSVAQFLVITAAFGASQSSPPLCSECAPNPIASFYPTQVTGTINSTIAVVPIPLSLARSIVPYRILTEAYKALLPNFPAGKYPLIVRSGCDHGIRVDIANFDVPDFQNIHITYPFVDLLDDNSTSFAFNHYFPVTSTNTQAIQGCQAYNGTPVPASFSPANQAYGLSSYGSRIIFEACTDPGNSPIMSQSFGKQTSIGPYSLDFYKNITNQPLFYPGAPSCDQQIQLWNSTLSTGSNAPVGIKGRVKIYSPYFPALHSRATVFEEVFGVAVDVAFIENNFLECETLKGYGGV